MDALICTGKPVDLIWQYMPRSLWWMVGGSATLTLLFCICIVLFLIQHLERPPGRHSDEYQDMLWRVGSIPTAILIMLLAYLDFRAITWFIDEWQHLQSYFNEACTIPLINQVIKGGA